MMNVFIMNVIEVLLSFLFTYIDTYIQNAHTYIRTFILFLPSVKALTRESAMAVSCARLCALMQVQREMMMVMGRRREVVVGTTTLAAVRGRDVMEKIGRRMLAVKAGKMGQGRRGGSGEGTTVTVLPAPNQQHQQQQQQAASQAAKTTTTMTATRGGGGGGASGGAGGDANKRNATYIYGAGAAALALSSLAAYYAIAPSRSKATKEKEEEATMEAELDSAAAGMVQRADEGVHEELNDSGRDEGREKEQEVKRMTDEEEERRGGVETSGDLGEPVVVMMAGDGMETQDELKADVEKRKRDEATAADSAPFEMQAATLIDDAISAAQVDASAFEETIESHSARAVAPSHDTSVAEEEGVLAAAGEREDGDAAAVSMNAAADDMPRTQKKEEEKEKDTRDAARDDDRIDGDNVTLEDLMQRSVRANLHAAGDWQAVNVAMKQAASDLGLFTRILEKERAGHDAEKARLTSTLEARDAAIESLRKDIDAVRIEGDENQRKALEEQKVALDLAKATAIIEERSQRTVEMDGIRGELNVLAEAFDLRRAETKARHDLHQLSLACFALDWSRGRGAPLAAAADAVKRFANGDPLIEAAIDAMPKVACERGALTQSQLRERFSRVRSSAASVSLIPLEGKGGIFAHSIAWLASMLRVREEAHTTGTHMGTEATLALAESLLVEGKIVKAIAVMEEGFKDSAASKIIQDVRTLVSKRSRVHTHIHTHTLSLCFLIVLLLLLLLLLGHTHALRFPRRNLTCADADVPRVTLLLPCALCASHVRVRDSVCRPSVCLFSCVHAVGVRSETLRKRGCDPQPHASARDDRGSTCCIGEMDTRTNVLFDISILLSIFTTACVQLLDFE